MPDSTKILLNLQEIKKQLSETRSIIQANQSNSFLGINEEYWTHFILPVLVPLLLSSIAFFLGRIFSTINSKRKKLNDLKEKERFLFIWIDLIQEPVVKQANFYKKYSDRLKELKSGQLKIINLHIDKLKVIDPSTMASLVVTNRRGDEKLKNSLLFNLENTIELIKRRDDSTKTLLDNVKGIEETTVSVWNDSFGKLQTVIHKLHNTYESLPDSETIKNILALFGQHTLSGEKGMNSWMGNFVAKAGPICSDYINLHNADELVIELMNTLQMLRHAYESRQKLFFDLADVFSESAELLSSSYQTLVNIKKDIAGLKYKKIYSIK